MSCKTLNTKVDGHMYIHKDHDLECCKRAHPNLFMFVLPKVFNKRILTHLSYQVYKWLFGMKLFSFWGASLCTLCPCNDSKLWIYTLCYNLSFKRSLKEDYTRFKFHDNKRIQAITSILNFTWQSISDWNVIWIKMWSEQLNQQSKVTISPLYMVQTT
jgi:hypothetical protein